MTTDPSKNEGSTEAEPRGVALLDFRRGPAAGLGCYAVLYADAGAVGIRAVRSPAELDSIASEHGIPVTPLPAELAALEDLARGAPVDVATVPVVLTGPPFFRKVWSALRRVPRGEVCTYGQLARAARSPRAMRAVGQAMARNPLPLVVPCHRVIADHARLGGYTGGVERKRALLALEDVDVDGDVVRPRQLILPS